MFSLHITKSDRRKSNYIDNFMWIWCKCVFSTLLSPPDTASIFPVIDQLTCHTTSLNLWSSLAVQVLPAGSSHVQINTRPSWKNGKQFPT